MPIRQKKYDLLKQTKKNGFGTEPANVRGSFCELYQYGKEHVLKYRILTTQTQWFTTMKLDEVFGSEVLGRVQ
jgi:hypothetical protein